MPTYDIILVSWNRGAYLKRTIGSLIQSGALETCQRFIIVDNHSLDDEVKMFLEVMRTYAKTFIITRPDNGGWATAVNDALGLSRAEYVLIINNDVEFEVGFIDKMFDIYTHQHGIGILGIWHHTSHSFVGISNQWFREMDNVPAVGWLISKEAMEKVGMLNEKGVCLTKGGNGEDTDYVGRMKQAGFLVGVPVRDIGVHLDGY